MGTHSYPGCRRTLVSWFRSRSRCATALPGVGSAGLGRRNRGMMRFDANLDQLRVRISKTMPPTKTIPPTNAIAEANHCPWVAVSTPSASAMMPITPAP